MGSIVINGKNVKTAVLNGKNIKTATINGKLLSLAKQVIFNLTAEFDYNQPDDTSRISYRISYTSLAGTVLTLVSKSITDNSNNFEQGSFASTSFNYNMKTYNVTVEFLATYESTYISAIKINGVNVLPRRIDYNNPRFYGQVTVMEP